MKTALTSKIKVIKRDCNKAHIELSVFEFFEDENIVELAGEAKESLETVLDIVEKIAEELQKGFDELKGENNA